MARGLSKAREAVARLSAANQLRQFRMNVGFAAELPLDGLGVVRDKNSLKRVPLHRPKYQLYKLYCVLVQVVQVATSEFSVVDPHDFIEALSWSDSVAAQDAQVIRRLREQTTTPLGTLKKLLVPFNLEADIFLAVVDLGGAVIQIIDQRTQEDLRTREQDDGFETSTFVYEFIRALFPDRCPSLRAWSIHFERTAQGPEPLNQPGLVCGRYVNELGRSIQLRSILPFFFEVLRIVCNMPTQKMVDDIALLKRIFALFDGTPSLKTSAVFQRLREESNVMLRDSLKRRVLKALADADKEFRIAVSCTRADSSDRCTPRQLIYVKLHARRHASIAVTQAHSVTGEIMAQYSHIRTLLEEMTARCVMTRSGTHHAMVRNLTAGWFYSKDGRREVWQPEVALNQSRSQGLNALARKLQDMKTELDLWLRLLNQHLDSSKMQ
ncbi:hypothetical protein SLS64_000740 [Diaporthe eres]